MTAIADHVAPPTDETRGARITNLAEQVIQDPDVYDAALIEVAMLAAPNLTPVKVRETFDDLCDQTERQMDFEAGAITWREVEPELSCPDPDTAAEQIVQQSVQDAHDLLVHGR
jgi:hypothetical protein